jgi:RNA polymerase primary sigma factor
MRFSSSYSRYQKTLASKEYSPLTSEIERKLLLEYAAGSQDAFSKLSKGYLRFVVYILKDFKVPDDIDVMDVIQEGTLGLMEGITRFDPSKYNCRVATYCVFWIKFYMKKFLAKKAVTRNLFCSIDDAASTAEEEVQTAREYLKNKDNGFIKREQIAEDIIHHCFGMLNNREKLVMIQFFGLVQSPKTLQEISSMLHVRIERVRQIKDTALNKVKKSDILELSI